MMKQFDTLITNGQIVVPGRTLEASVSEGFSIGVKGGRIAAITRHPGKDDAHEIIDATGLTVFPGAVDSHFHLGIYRPMSIDTLSETQSCLVGGVTSVLSYFRSGQHYMGKTGSYKELFPEALKQLQGNSYVDYGLHIAPMEDGQVGEMEWLAKEQGVTTFKYFMFYKGLNLAANSASTEALTGSGSYDLGHLFNIMEEAARLNRTFPGDSAPVCVSVHCEDDELIKAFIKKVNAAGIDGLHAYCDARPPLSERIAILKAGTIAAETGALLNVLHLGGKEALETTYDLLKLYPQIKLRREVTLHGLGLTYDMLAGKGMGGKVNPPIRTKEDNEALWQGIVKGDIDWVGSDHACTPISMKPDSLWQASCGFGGTSLMYPYMISAGHFDRHLPLHRIAELVSANPAKAHGLYPRKGEIAVGMDADFALVDLDMEKSVTADMLHSAQEYTPFEGMALRGWPIMTMLRGRTVFKDGQTVGAPGGVYLKRPCF